MEGSCTGWAYFTVGSYYFFCTNFNGSDLKWRNWNIIVRLIVILRSIILD
jgi:hypothetical protein